MKTTWTALLVLLIALPARALVLGGGDPDKDCRLAFDGAPGGAVDAYLRLVS